jgi:hypothetical protein
LKKRKFATHIPLPSRAKTILKLFEHQPPTPVKVIVRTWFGLKSLTFYWVLSQALFLFSNVPASGTATA